MRWRVIWEGEEGLVGEFPLSSAYVCEQTGPVYVGRPRAEVKKGE